jgi:hypothetical protein
MGTMSLDEHIWYIHEAKWFNRNLQIPSCFYHPVFSSIKFKAHSWFKLNKEFIEFFEKSVSVAKLLEKHGIPVSVKFSDNPGKIVYEDGLQIVILPHA